jgi:hypothetical protein
VLLLMIDNGKKECMSLRNLLECSKLADELAMADEHLKETLKRENACKVLPSHRLLLVIGHMNVHRFGLSNPLDLVTHQWSLSLEAKHFGTILR